MIGVQPPHNPLNLELENALTIDSQYPKPIVVNSLTHNDAGTATYPHAQLLTGGQAWSSMSAGDGVTTNESHAVSHRESPGWKRKASLPLDGWLGSMSMNSPSPAPPSASSAGLPPPDAPGPSNWQSTPLQSPNSQTSSQYQYHAEASSSSKSLHLRPHAPHPRSRSASKLRSQDGDAEQSKVSHSGSAHDSDPRFSRGVGVAGIRNEDTERERERTEGIEDRWSDSKVPARQRFSDGRLGILPPEANRKYTAIKLVGDGSFGTVWLCDWAAPVPPSTTLSAMQCGAGARRDWVGKRLVAVKRMKRVWKGGWEEASRLGELVSLRDIPQHPAIIPLYDAFIQPDSRELYFVFECMEGNLYQLTKSRKGRPLAAGLVASIYHQMVGGLHHIHHNGYFHRDMKPENLLVTTTGLQDYMPVIDPETAASDRLLSLKGLPVPQRPNPRIEKDVTVIVKLADFGLARSLTSLPPYTEYVSTRWYRAPEVLLRSKEYSAPVDMWALGTILAELVNLKAIFPGQGEVDQVYRITEVLGDPSREYGRDERGRQRGGGDWDRGIKMAKAVGFSFPKKTPAAFTSLFSPAVPISLIDCIADLLRYNPRYRMTSADCLNHPYYHLTLPHLRAAAKLPSIPFSQGQPTREVIDEMLSQGTKPATQPNHTPSPSTVAHGSIPPSHPYSPVQNKPAFGTDNGRTLPPPHVSSDSGSGSQMFFPSRHGSSPSPATDANARSGTPSSAMLHSSVPGAKTGASALVDQLRELDLPTADLASYGHRPGPSPGAQSAYPGNATQSWKEAGHSTLGPALAPPQQRSANYQLEMDRGAYQSPSDSSRPQQQHQRSALPIHMLTPTALASGGTGDYSPYGHDPQKDSSQEPMEDVVMAERATNAPQSPRSQPPVEPAPSIQVSRGSSLLQAGKKKKWGLSSVFGKDSDSKAQSQTQTPPPIHEQYAASTLSLKRTQSGHIAGDRRDFPEPSPNASPIILDPKKAKKEAERQAKELERAKRDAAERAQKERARAVMQKRNQLQQERKVAGATTEFEWSSVESPRHAPPGVVPTGKGMFGLGNISVRSHGEALSRPEAHVPTDAASSDGGQSQSSSRQAPSATHSRLSHQSMQALQAQGSPLYDPAKADEYRAKARRRDDDDDHSTSSLSVNRFQSPSTMTVGTIDSDPGPARSPRQYWNNPGGRSTSTSSFNLRHMQMRSNTSLGQLAQDFAAHANVAGPSSHACGSSSSLGRYAASSTSFSGPTTPYGHTMSHAVAGGNGVGRHPGNTLPSIADWEHSPDVQMNGDVSDVNPMFRVAMPEGLEYSQHQTLPPFSAIASVADSQSKQPPRRDQSQH